MIKMFHVGGSGSVGDHGASFNIFQIADYKWRDRDDKDKNEQNRYDFIVYLSNGHTYVLSEDDGTRLTKTIDTIGQ